MRRRHSSRPVLALVGLLILFGHDAVMAANPHGQPSVHAEHTVEHDPVENRCHIQEGVRPAHFDLSDVPFLNLSPHLLPAEFLSVAARWSVCDTSPGFPPDVLRALLQVYLN